MVCSGFCALLPARYTDPVKNVVQFLVPFQDVSYRFTQRLADHAEQLADPEVTGAGYRRLVEQVRAMENRLVAADAELQDLRQENEWLTKLSREPALARARLIPARVVAQDPSGLREALAINEGRSGGVRRGDYVASRMLVVHGQQVAPRVGMGVVGAEYLIGRVHRVRSFAAGVMLFSDRGSAAERVRIGRLADGRFAAVSKADERSAARRECDFVLIGRGDGLMLIEQVLAEYIESDPASGRSYVGNPIRVGDLVVSFSADSSLPCRMVVGEVIGIAKDSKNPLLYNLEVRCPVDPTRLSWVYVIDMLGPDS